LAPYSNTHLVKTIVRTARALLLESFAQQRPSPEIQYASVSRACRAIPALTRAQADAATGDVEHFLGWRFRHDPVRDWHDGLPVTGARFLLNDRVETTAGRRGVVVGLLQLAPEATYLVDFPANDSEADVPPATVVDSALRPVS
jgi:hypothetical protein